jgi:hypothetical protein
MGTAFPISKGIHELPLGEVFQYIFSVEWGISPELTNASPCNNVHYQNANEAARNSEIGKMIVDSDKTI